MAFSPLAGLNGSHCIIRAARSEIISIFLLCIIGLLAGCPAIWKADEPDKPASAEQLYKAAEEFFEKKEYSKAIENYERLKSAYPDFKDIPKVYMKIADAFYNDGAYEKAAARYQQFVELYPGHEDVPKAKFNIAMCSFKQIKNTDLDTRIVQRAAELFKALADDPNAGDWAKKAEEKYQECRKKLAEKELYKAKTYISMGNYNAARHAARRVLEEYPKFGFDKEVNEIINKIKNK